MSYDYLIYAMASGETSQAYAVLKELQKRSLTFIFAIGKPIGENFFGKEHAIPYEFAPTTKELKQLVEKYNPRNIIFFNSKSFRRELEFIKTKPTYLQDIPCYTLDSNWLFENSKTYPSLLWAEKNFVNFPQSLFEKGLKENGGYFSIAPTALQKIHPVGFIPSYKKISSEQHKTIRDSFGLTGEQKLIFCYFSGYGAAARYWVLENLIHALDLLNDKQIKVIYSGEPSLVNTQLLSRPYLIHEKNVTVDRFYQLLSSSDLIFQHQGLATMAQGIAAQIPIIANIDIYPQEEMPELHLGELQPFEKLGLCRLYQKNSPIQEIAQAIQTYLYSKPDIATMKDNHQKLYSGGEESLITHIQQGD